MPEQYLASVRGRQVHIDHLDGAEFFDSIPRGD
jgi:hypothetical protein